MLAAVRVATIAIWGWLQIATVPPFDCHQRLRASDSSEI
jgi:hypothetical protein